MKETNRTFIKKEASPKVTSKVNKNGASTSQANLQKNIKSNKDSKKEIHA
jgi:hypothetical protein